MAAEDVDIAHVGERDWCPLFDEGSETLLAAFGLPMEEVVEVTELAGGPLLVPQDLSYSQGAASYLWRASRALASLLDSGTLLHLADCCAGGRKASCIELGAGLGLVSMVLQRRGCRVCCTDMPEVCPLLSNVLEVNSARVFGVEVAPFLWSDVLPPQLSAFTGSQSLDLIVGADIMHHIYAVSDLAKAVNALAGPNTLVILSQEMRGGAEQVFLKELKRISGDFTHRVASPSELHLGDEAACKEELDEGVLRIMLLRRGLNCEQSLELPLRLSCTAPQK